MEVDLVNVDNQEGLPARYPTDRLLSMRSLFEKKKIL